MMNHRSSTYWVAAYLFAVLPAVAGTAILYTWPIRVATAAGLYGMVAVTVVAWMDRGITASIKGGGGGG